MKKSATTKKAIKLTKKEKVAFLNELVNDLTTKYKLVKTGRFISRKRAISLAERLIKSIEKS